DHRLKQRSTITSAAKRFVDPHLLDLRNACPSIAGGDTDRIAIVVANHEAHAPAVMPSGRRAIVLIQAVFNGVDFYRREVVARLWDRLHFDLHPPNATS